MAEKSLPSPDMLRQLFRYEQETGKLYHAARPTHSFAAGPRQKNAAAIWNARQAGKEAGGISNHGYLRVSINGRLYLAHRIAWAMVTGAWPSGDLDHINGDRTDNRISNLRIAPPRENNRNLSRREDNASGVTGVARARGKWRAYIEGTNLGHFATLEAAISARKAAEKALGYHPNHGRPKSALSDQRQ